MDHETQIFRRTEYLNGQSQRADSLPSLVSDAPKKRRETRRRTRDPRSATSPRNAETWPHETPALLALLWQFRSDGVGEEFLTVRASLGWRLGKEVEDGLPNRRHGWLWRWAPDSFFSVPLL